MKKLLLAATALALTAGLGMAQTVRMGTEGAYPPYNFINEAGEVAGFERELGDELCKRAELDCTWSRTTGTRSSRTWCRRTMTPSWPR